MDRLLQLMMQTMQLDPNTPRKPEPEAIERGIEMLKAVLASPEAAQAGGNIEGTFVILGMALEEKPMLQDVAIRCYEKALDYMQSRPRGSWERCVVLQQLGTVCMKHARLQEAGKWLDQCSTECSDAKGHPRDTMLFGGGFSTQQTRLQFQTTVAKLQTHLYSKLGDEAKARSHAAELERLARAAQGDAVARMDPQASKSSSSGSTAAETEWAAQWKKPAETRSLREYGFVDEGPTVLLMLDLNSHLGLGADASSLVTSLKQFKVNCEEKSLEVLLRLQLEEQLIEYALNLNPLAYEIVPEDTVPRLRGKPDRRRLEVRLFKRDKDVAWRGDLGTHAKSSRASAEQKGKASTKGTLLQPLSPEELAALPRPTTSGAGGENRPSSWLASNPQTESLNPDLPKQDEASTAAAFDEEDDGSAEVRTLTAWPEWLSGLDQMGFLAPQARNGNQEAVLTLHFEETARIRNMQDLTLDAAPDLRRLKISLRHHSETLELKVPKDIDVAALSARWRRKVLALELRLPRLSVAS